MLENEWNECMLLLFSNYHSMLFIFKLGLIPRSLLRQFGNHENLLFFLDSRGAQEFKTLDIRDCWSRSEKIRENTPSACCGDSESWKTFSFLEKLGFCFSGPKIHRILWFWAQKYLFLCFRQSLYIMSSQHNSLGCILHQKVRQFYYIILHQFTNQQTIRHINIPHVIKILP